MLSSCQLTDFLLCARFHFLVDDAKASMFLAFFSKFKNEQLSFDANELQKWPQMMLYVYVTVMQNTRIVCILNCDKAAKTV